MPFAGVGGVALVVLTTKYLLGAGEAAVNEPLNEVVVTALNSNADAKFGVVQAASAAGVHVKVRPDAGKIVLENVHLSVLTAPAVVAAQSVAVVLELKSAVVVLIPIGVLFAAAEAVICP